MEPGSTFETELTRYVIRHKMFSNLPLLMPKTAKRNIMPIENKRCTPHFELLETGPRVETSQNFQSFGDLQYLSKPRILHKTYMLTFQQRKCLIHKLAKRARC